MAYLRAPPKQQHEHIEQPHTDGGDRCPAEVLEIHASHQNPYRGASCLACYLFRGKMSTKEPTYPYGRTYRKRNERTLVDGKPVVFSVGVRALTAPRGIAFLAGPTGVGKTERLSRRLERA